MGVSEKTGLAVPAGFRRGRRSCMVGDIAIVARECVDGGNRGVARIDGKVGILGFDERRVIGGGGGGSGVAEVALGVEDAELGVVVEPARVGEVGERFGRAG